MAVSIIIPQNIYDAIIAQALAERPRECCGVLGGNGGRVQSRYPLRNEAPQPERRYEAAPQDLFAAMRAMRARGEEMVAIYHSHPRGPAQPSPTDIELAFYAEAVYLIIALEPQLEVRGFAIKEQLVSAVTIEITETAPLP